MKIIILCAGKGRRMLIDYPKSLLKINTKYSIIKNIYKNFIKQGIKNKELIFATGYKPDLIKKEIGNKPNFVNNKKYATTNMVYTLMNAVKKIDDDYIVFTHGGRTQTDLKAFDWCLDCQQRGAGEILLTSMDKDGTKDGFDIEILSKISSNVNIPVIASGGAGNLDHLYQAIVKGNADAVLAASIFHFGEYTINQAKEYLKAKGILVR